MRTKQALTLLVLAGFVVLGLATTTSTSSTAQHRMGHGNVKQNLAQKLQKNVGLKVPEPKILAQTTVRDGDGGPPGPAVPGPGAGGDLPPIGGNAPIAGPSVVIGGASDGCGCDCDLNVRSCCCNDLQPNVQPCVASIPPLGSVNLGFANVEEGDLQFQANQAINLHEEPDIRLVHDEQSACCSAEEVTHESCTKGCKFRHFCIKGDICVSEQVTFKENSIEDIDAEGFADKNTVAVDTTDAGSLGSQECLSVMAENPLELGLCDPFVPPTPQPCTTVGDNHSVCPTNLICTGTVNHRVCTFATGHDTGCTQGGNPAHNGNACSDSGSSGKCSQGYCQITVCNTDADCKATNALFCAHPHNDPLQPKTCLFASDFP